MRSVNVSGDQLFPPIADQTWLELLDTRYENGVEILSPLGGSRSGGERTRTYRAYYLEPGGRRRSSFVLKVGHTNSIERDYQGWLNFARRQPDRDSFAKMDPPLAEHSGEYALMIIDFVGSRDLAMRSLAEQAGDPFPLLTEAIERVVNRTLKSLHEGLRPRHGGGVPWFSLTQSESLGNWSNSRVTNAAKRQLQANPLTAEAWMAPQIADDGYVLSLRNHLPDLLSGRALPHGDVEIRLPHGVAHGDPNFDNIFIASGDSSELAGVALIDFEWCSKEPPNSPYDDLATIECELLFGQLAPKHRRELSHAISLGDPLLRQGAPLSVSEEPDRALFNAIKAVRARVGELASLAGAGTSEELARYLRGYFTALLGKALRYLGYEGPSAEARAEALVVCQLLAARLATPDMRPLPPRFSLRPAPRTIARGSVSHDGDGYVLTALETGAYAGLVLAEPAATSDFLALCDIEIVESSKDGWVMFGVGADVEVPQRSGIGGLLRIGSDGHVRTSILSHAQSRHDEHGPALGGLAEALRAPVVVSLQRSSLELNFQAEIRDRTLPSANVSVALPADSYRGAFAIFAHNARVRVSSLRLQLIDPAVEHRDQLEPLPS